MLGRAEVADAILEPAHGTPIIGAGDEPARLDRTTLPNAPSSQKIFCSDAEMFHLDSKVIHYAQSRALPNGRVAKFYHRHELPRNADLPGDLFSGEAQELSQELERMFHPAENGTGSEIESMDTCETHATRASSFCAKKKGNPMPRAIRCFRGHRTAAMPCQRCDTRLRRTEPYEIDHGPARALVHALLITAGFVAFGLACAAVIQ